MREDLPDGLDHGLAVTSAFLFGPVQPDSVVNQPCRPDHIRVLENHATWKIP